MSAPRLKVTLAALAAFALACAVSKRDEGDAPRVGEQTAPAERAPKDAAPAVSGDLSLARQALLAGDACYRDRPAYCVTDPAFVDPILAEVIARSFKGQAPSTAQDAEAVARRARGAFSSRQFETPEARALVEAEVRAYWEQPDIAQEQRLYRADLGVPPGSFERAGRAGWDIVHSPLVVDGELDGKVAATRLQALRAARPDGVTWALQVEVPVSAGGFVKQEIRYQSNRDRVVVRRADRSNEAWFTPKLGGDLSAYASGAKSLHTSQLESCKLKDSIWGVEPDCLN